MWMMRMLPIALLTLGYPGTLTGGYLYHRRLAELAPAHDARIDFVSFPHRPFPLAALHAPAALRDARRLGARALVLDSIVAAYLPPGPLAGPSPAPLVAMLHQPPGGIDHGPLRTAIQARLDRLAYRRARPLLGAREAPAHELAPRGGARAPPRVGAP